MSEAPEMTCRPFTSRPGRFFAVFGVVTGVWAVPAGLLPMERGGWFVVWLAAGFCVIGLGLLLLPWVAARVRADAVGVHARMLRRRSVPWSEVADLQVRLQRVRHGHVRRLDVVLRGGGTVHLPLPQSAREDDPAFDRQVEQLRALHRRYGTPRSAHLPVVSYRTAGRGRRLLLALFVLLLAGAGLAASFVPGTDAQRRAWEAAVPCAQGVPAAARGGCLTTVPAVIARSDPHGGKRASWLYFTGSRPVRRVQVSYEGAQGFTAGHRVEVTVWRGEVREVAGDGHLWREHMTPPGDVAVIAAGLALGAGYPGALLLVRRRGRRLAGDEVLPSALPFAGVLLATAAWLLPLCYLHPTTLFSSRAPAAWWAAGLLLTLVLSALAWRATRVRSPGEGGRVPVPPVCGETFLAARFLDQTDYNPYFFGTHVVLGDGPPAVVPHAGPGRTAARRIPVERLTAVNVRRARGEENVRRSWHVAELDDAGTLVRLAAAPADLARILRELGLEHLPAPAAGHGT
ncbi:PH domain-containing protein [Streptomyces lycii]|uniref:PH domain-containing protein n=1 Tax=Streptomyces lycii TaxID=2654337 RepID=A0ABQ7FL67_9ACTN|nr:PH domain-containing protein [Streptomyces lycii]KAF4407947.1 PH domain-containing protein [Streptomyces lycii]